MKLDALAREVRAISASNDEENLRAEQPDDSDAHDRRLPETEFRATEFRATEPRLAPM